MIPDKPTATEVYRDMADAEWIGRDAERLAVILDALKLAAVVEHPLCQGVRFILDPPLRVVSFHIAGHDVRLLTTDEAFAALYGEEER